MGYSVTTLSYILYGHYHQSLDNCFCECCYWTSKKIPLLSNCALQPHLPFKQSY